jgi:hypothetical protein
MLAGCVSTQEAVQRHEDHLIAAGFIERPANKPRRQEMLKRLPPNRFVKCVHGDDVQYVYADPLVCDCLYVETQQAYSKYMDYLQQRDLADEQAATAQMYADPAWACGGHGGLDLGFMAMGGSHTFDDRHRKNEGRGALWSRFVWCDRCPATLPMTLGVDSQTPIRPDMAV